MIVIDNASHSPTREWLDDAARQFGLGIIRNEKNEGFGAAHDRAFEFALGTYFVVLNSDCVVKSGWLETFREAFAKNPNLAVCGLKGTSCHLNPLGVGCPGEPDYVEGSCLVTLTHLARKHTLFDPIFRFAYCEDADYSLRMRKLGYDIAHVEAPVTHLGGKTAELVRKEGVDLDGFHAYNHEVLRARWGDYLRTHVFASWLDVRRTAAIGDLLMLEPVLRSMQALNYSRRIYLTTDCPQAIPQYPSNVSPPDCQPVDLDGVYEKKPWLHPTAAFAEALGLKEFSYRPRFRPTTPDRENAKLWNKRLRAVIYPHIGQDANWPGRNPPRDVLAKVDQHLRIRGWDTIWVAPDSFSTLSALGAMIERAHLYVGVDSAPMHLARAAMVPLVGIFGSIRPELRLTPSCGFERGVTARGVGCLGCHHAYTPPRTTGKCIRDRQYCMERLDADDIIRAIDEVLEAKRMQLETSKIRDRVLKYCEGRGIDIGCQRDPVTPDCIALDDDDWPEVNCRADARKIPFPDGHFDWVYSSHCLEDIADTELAIREWLRVLRSGGTIVIQVPHPELYKGVNLEHLHPGFTPGELELLLSRAGCSIEESFIDDRPPLAYSTVVAARKR